MGEGSNACFGIFMHCILFLQQRQHLFRRQCPDWSFYRYAVFDTLFHPGRQCYPVLENLQPRAFTRATGISLRLEDWNNIGLMWMAEKVWMTALRDWAQWQHLCFCRGDRTTRCTVIGQPFFLLKTSSSSSQGDRQQAVQLVAYGQNANYIPVLNAKGRHQSIELWPRHHFLDRW